MPEIKIGKRKIGSNHPPFVIAEIGINHNGSLAKAKRMIHDAKKAGAECVKFQGHVLEDEMLESEARKTIPANAKISIWEIMARCALSEEQERELKKYTEKLGMIFLSTPFSRAAADRLERMGVKAFKIGSGECNNYPLVEHVARFGKPMIVSTGMNDIASIKKTVAILKKHKVPFALLHCTNLYPTPWNRVYLQAITKMEKTFPDAVIGFSNHSAGPWAALGAVALGASILERHFTSDRAWKGEDIAVSMDPQELSLIIKGSRAIWESRGDHKGPLREEQPTIDFAFASVVSIAPIKKGEKFTKKNIWVKRPGTGELKAVDYSKILGKRAARSIAKDAQIKRKDVL
ncbi:MAG: N-acetylneuraminate synthase family protein [Parcubacteria group bacterium]|nr:N-acetylneuraminate synthase family protein [Parcubacteria group bacterium]